MCGGEALKGSRRVGLDTVIWWDQTSQAASGNPSSWTYAHPSFCSLKSDPLPALCETRERSPCPAGAKLGLEALRMDRIHVEVSLAARAAAGSHPL